MTDEKKPIEKNQLHARNRNRERYDLKALIISNPELETFVKPNKYGNDSVDFANSEAVKTLNKALLNHYYGIENWDFPDQNLCPPIPGRAEYIHHVADLLGESNLGSIPTGNKITCYDIGVGASCIYPILGVTEYQWNFIGSEIDAQSLKSAQKIVDSNPTLKGKIDLRLQKNPKQIFEGIIGMDEKIDLTLCNPPFHASAEEAQKGALRKIKNLSGKNDKAPTLNFAGVHHELISEGGELAFINNMIRESKKISRLVFWFSTIVSKQSNLRGVYKSLKKVGAHEVKTIPLGTGNKTSRVVAWTFLDEKGQENWRELRWK